MPKDKTLVENIKWKAITTVIALSLVWFISKVVGFPVLFRWMFVMYVILMFLFFLLLDAPSMGPRKRGVLSIFVTFLIGSAVYTLMGIGSPQYDPIIEMEKIRKLTIERIKLEEIESPQELIEAGKDVYDLYECYNCHKIGGEGGVKRRGPELDEIGWESDLYIEETILDPLSWIPPKFDKPKLRDAMPDYYSEEFEEGEYKALIAYMKSLRPGPERMPRDWWTNPRIILEGKDIYDGIFNPAVNCAACHGRDGQPIMTGARSLRDPDIEGSEKTDANHRRPLKEWSDKDWFDAVSKGVPGTAMLAMGMFLSEIEIWKVAAYSATFSGIKGTAREDLKGFFETRQGKILTAYLKKEEERVEKVEELKMEILGEEEEEEEEE